MKIKPYVDKLKSSSEFGKFREEKPGSFMTAGFFVIDFESGNNIHQIDFYIPSEKKVAAFSLDEKLEVQLMDMVSEKGPEELQEPINTDLDVLKGIIHDEMRNRGMSEEIKKIIAVIQMVDGVKTWIINCVLSGMEILKVHIDDESQGILKMEKLSMLDLIKTVPTNKISGNVGEVPDIKEELGKLKDLEKEIKKEESEIEKELEKDSDKEKS